jgi:hypothetical protein
MSARAEGAEHASDLALDEMLDGAGRPETAVHVTTCAACGARLDELRRDRDAFLERARPAVFADAVLARAKKRRWWPFAVALAPLVLGAAAVVLVWSRPHPIGEPDTRVKGELAASELYVQAGGKVEKFDPARAYHAGDALQLVYSVSQPRYLTVVDAEQGGRVELVYKGGAPLGPAARSRLDRSFVLDGSAPSERLYVLFTEAPPDESALLAEARKDPEHTETLPVKAAGQQSYLIHR